MTLTADAETDESRKPKASKKPLIIGLVLAILGATAGFMVTSMGFLPFGGATTEDAVSTPAKDAGVTEDVVFISLEPITISLPPGSDRRLLRLVAQLDVAPENAAAVEAVTPRILDILNTYLRALRIEDFESPTALLRLRTHMLHRVQIVTGQGVVRDLLITEFVIN